MFSHKNNDTDDAVYMFFPFYFMLFVHILILTHHIRN